MVQMEIDRQEWGLTKMFDDSGTNVVSINYDNNYITDIEIDKIPDSIVKFKIANCQLNQIIDASVIHKNIVELDIMYNNITHFDGSELLNIRLLILNGNKMVELILPPNAVEVHVYSCTLKELPDLPKS